MALMETMLHVIAMLSCIRNTSFVLVWFFFFHKVNDFQFVKICKEFESDFSTCRFLTD